MAFLHNLYRVFPELASMELFLAGESYAGKFTWSPSPTIIWSHTDAHYPAGQYIPYIATRLLDSKENQHSIQGLIIGNGWFSARDQYPAYIDYLVDENLVKKGSKGYKKINVAIERCVEEMGIEGNRTNGEAGLIILPVCEEILNVIAEVTKKESVLSYRVSSPVSD